MKTSIRLLVTTICAGAIVALSQGATASSDPSVAGPVSFEQALETVTRAVAPNPWPLGLASH